MNELLSQVFERHPNPRLLYLRLACTNGSVPCFYGLPKVLKPGVPLRLIGHFSPSPLRALLNYLHRVLLTLTGRMFTQVWNSRHLVELLSQETVSLDEALVSFDDVASSPTFQFLW